MPTVTRKKPTPKSHKSPLAPAEYIDLGRQDLATKSDIINLERDMGKIRGEIGEVRGKIDSLNNKIDGVKSELNNKIDGIKNELNNKIDGVKNELNSKIDGIKNELKGQMQILILLTSGTFLAILGAAITLFLKT